MNPILINVILGASIVVKCLPVIDYAKYSIDISANFDKKRFRNHVMESTIALILYTRNFLIKNNNNVNKNIA